MQVGEPVAMFKAVNVSDPVCDKPAEDSEKWEAKINEWGTIKGCSGTALYKSMEDKDWKADQGFLGGPDAFVAKSPKTEWTLALVKPDKFPVQAHHLIPKNHLPKHAVCTFLAKNYTKHKKYQLKKDAPYNTDGANNGYCMPYATPLAEWKKMPHDWQKGLDAWKLNVCFLVMEKAGRQLHQGSHREDPYGGGPIPDDEEARIHDVGYLDLVNRLLAVVQGGAALHAERCRICNPNPDEGAKVELEPRQAVVTHMDQVSGIVKLLADANRTFVSEPASLYGKRQENPALPGWLTGGA